MLFRFDHDMKCIHSFIHGMKCIESLRSWSLYIVSSSNWNWMRENQPTDRKDYYLIGGKKSNRLRALWRENFLSQVFFNSVINFFKCFINLVKLNRTGNFILFRCSMCSIFLGVGSFLQDCLSRYLILIIVLFDVSNILIRADLTFRSYSNFEMLKFHYSVILTSPISHCDVIC